MSAKYKALGAGLMAFGSGLQQQMAETARQRREESLLALKRQWELDNRDFRIEREDSLLDRTEARQDAQRTEDHNRAIEQETLRHNLATGRSLMEHELGEPLRTAQIGQLQTQANAANAKLPFDIAESIARAENSIALAEDRRTRSERGPDGLTAAQRNEALTFRRDVFRETANVAEGMFKTDPRGIPNIRTYLAMHEADAERLGIDESTPMTEAMMLVRRDLVDRYVGEFGGHFGIDPEVIMDLEDPEQPTADPEGLSGVPPQVISRVQQLLAQGADEEEIAAALAAHGEMRGREIIEYARGLQ